MEDTEQDEKHPSLSAAVKGWIILNATQSDPSVDGLDGGLIQIPAEILRTF